MTDFAAPTLIGDDLVSIEMASAALAQELAGHLRALGIWTEVVAGLRSVVVQFDSADWAPGSVLQAVAAECEGFTPAGQTIKQAIEIPLQYGGAGGPDLASVCAVLGLSEADFIARHGAATYRVEMIGFTPGFAYCSGLDPALSVPRLATPRTRLAAGSVGISTGQCGVYALEGPGGWPVIGRTPLPLFRQQEADPFLLQPGMSVRFIAS